MTPQYRTIQIGSIEIGPNKPLAILTGPCSIESEEHCLRCAELLSRIFKNLPVSWIFKASYDKANRSSHTTYRGVGMDEGLRILQRVQNEFGVPVVSDVHTPQEAEAVAQVCDLLQLPAFLCRQTDLTLAAAKTGKPLHIKKGQFMAPWDMQSVVKKVESCQNYNILLCDRGTSFGYNYLISDMRAIPVMQETGYPVCFDATHSVQMPGAHGTSSGGQRQFVPTLAKAAVAAGCDALFMESHPDPEHALSDKDLVLNLQDLPALLDVVIRLRTALQAPSP